MGMKRHRVGNNFIKNVCLCPQDEFVKRVPVPWPWPLHLWKLSFFIVLRYSEWLEKTTSGACCNRLISVHLICVSALYWEISELYVNIDQVYFIYVRLELYMYRNSGEQDPNFKDPFEGTKHLETCIHVKLQLNALRTRDMSQIKDNNSQKCC